jgi:hypothetical protein
LRIEMAEIKVKGKTYGEYKMEEKEVSEGN